MIGSGNKIAKRIGMRTLRFVLAFAVAVFVASGVAYAKPPPPAVLNEELCGRISGVWAHKTCTIPQANSGVVSSKFMIEEGIKLDIVGSLTINRGAQIANFGTIIVENENGIAIIPDMPDELWKPGLLVFGELENSGTINVENEIEGTEGISVSYLLDLRAGNLSPDIVLRGALTNLGAINIRNKDHTRGIKNIGTLTNSASGVIKIENTIASSAGIYNKRGGGEDPLPGTFKIEGIMTNAGRMTISNSGDCVAEAQLPVQDPCGYGLYNQGLFVISAAGSLVINPSPEVVVDPPFPEAGLARGLFNGGSITNYGTFINDRGDFTNASRQLWGSFNIGTMINYGTTTAKGTWLNANAMINLGTVTNGTQTSYGIMYDASEGHTMLNYGTIYNYGGIEAGVNYGICIDEEWTDAEGNYHNGSGC